MSNSVDIDLDEIVKRVDEIDKMIKKFTHVDNINYTIPEIYVENNTVFDENIKKINKLTNIFTNLNNEILNINDTKYLDSVNLVEYNPKIQELQELQELSEDLSNDSTTKTIEEIVKNMENNLSIYKTFTTHPSELDVKPPINKYDVDNNSIIDNLRIIDDTKFKFICSKIVNDNNNLNITLPQKGSIISSEELPTKSSEELPTILTNFINDIEPDKYNKNIFKHGSFDPDNIIFISDENDKNDKNMNFYKHMIVKSNEKSIELNNTFKGTYAKEIESIKEKIDSIKIDLKSTKEKIDSTKEKIDSTKPNPFSDYLDSFKLSENNSPDKIITQLSKIYTNIIYLQSKLNGIYIPDTFTYETVNPMLETPIYAQHLDTLISSLIKNKELVDTISKLNTDIKQTYLNTLLVIDINKYTYEKLINKSEPDISNITTNINKLQTILNSIDNSSLTPLASGVSCPENTTQKQPTTQNQLTINLYNLTNDFKGIEKSIKKYSVLNDIIKLVNFFKACTSIDPRKITQIIKDQNKIATKQKSFFTSVDQLICELKNITITSDIQKIISTISKMYIDFIRVKTLILYLPTDPTKPTTPKEYSGSIYTKLSQYNKGGAYADTLVTDVNTKINSIISDINKHTTENTNKKNIYTTRYNNKFYEIHQLFYSGLHTILYNDKSKTVPIYLDKKKVTDYLTKVNDILTNIKKTSGNNLYYLKYHFLNLKIVQSLMDTLSNKWQENKIDNEIDNIIYATEGKIEYSFILFDNSYDYNLKRAILIFIGIQDILDIPIKII